MKTKEAKRWKMRKENETGKIRKSRRRKVRKTNERVNIREGIEDKEEVKEKVKLRKIRN